MNRFPRRQLHVLTDPDWISEWESWARDVSCAGANVIQYRDKREGAHTWAKEHLRVLTSAVQPSTRILVNDSVEWAQSSNADGVHLGSTDGAVDVARGVLDERCWIGRTANSLEEARRCDAMGADYLGIGPFRATASKANPAPVLGVAGLAEIVAAVGTPVIAIGGIELEDLPALFALPIHGVAVIGAITKSGHAGRQTRRFREAIDTIESVR